MVCSISSPVKEHHPSITCSAEVIALSNRLEVGRWSFGRPVFKKVNGETRFLYVESGLIHWVVSNDLTGQIREGRNKWWIASGRGTNDPTLLAAGPSVRLNTTRWRYWAGSGYKEQPGKNLLARDANERKLSRYQPLFVSKSNGI